MLFQYPNDLFFTETASLHRLSSQMENRLTSNAGHFRGAGQLRRSKAGQIYRKTGDLRAVQLLLGHTKVDSAVH